MEQVFFSVPLVALRLPRPMRPISLRTILSPTSPQIFSQATGGVETTSSSDKTTALVTISGLKRSSLLAILYGERSTVRLKSRNFSDAIADADTCLRLLRAHKACRSAVKNKASALLDGFKQYQKCVDWLDSPTASEVLQDEDESEAESIKSRAETAIKKGKRADYYMILSKSPSVREMIALKAGSVWRTCAEPESEAEDEESDEERRKRRGGYLTSYSQQAQIKTAYRRRCLELHPDKQATRLSGENHSLTEREQGLYKKNVDEHFKVGCYWWAGKGLFGDLRKEWGG